MSWYTRDSDSWSTSARYVLWDDTRIEWDSLFILWDAILRNVRWYSRNSSNWYTRDE